MSEHFPMPKGISKDLHEYARGVFADLLKKFPNQAEAGEHVGLDQSRVSAVRRDGKTSLQVLLKAAFIVGRSREEILTLMGVDTKRIGPSDDPLIDKFLLGVHTLPGLRKFVTDNPLELHVSEVCRGMVAYETTPSLARSDGQPHQGWEAFFGDLRAGKIEPTTAAGDAAKAAELEHAQNPDLLKNTHTRELKRKRRTS